MASGCEFKNLKLELDEETDSKKGKKHPSEPPTTLSNRFHVNSGMQNMLALYQLHQTAVADNLGATHSSTAGCSRRALLKQRKLCHFCHRKPASIVEQGVIENEQLRFCSEECLSRFKLEIFTQETVACLVQDSVTPRSSSSQSVSPLPVTCSQRTPLSREQSPPKLTPGLPHDFDQSAIPVLFNTQSASTATAKKSINRPRKRRRGANPRPHPGYALNKRYWEELKAKNESESDQKSSVNHVVDGRVSSVSSSPGELVGCHSSGVSPSGSSERSQVSPTAGDKAVEISGSFGASVKGDSAKSDMAAITQSVKAANLGNSSNFPWFQNFTFIPIPVPVPVPIPFPVPDRLFGKVKKDMMIDLD